MKQKDKQLLLKDLCGRLPYGIKLAFCAKATNETYTVTLSGIVPENGLPIIAETDSGSFYMLAEHIKPYLFPLSSMTDEQRKEFENTCIKDCFGILYWSGNTFDWLNKNHFDYRDLIKRGLAKDATRLSIYQINQS